MNNFDTVVDMCRGMGMTTETIQELFAEEIAKVKDQCMSVIDGAADKINKRINETSVDAKEEELIAEITNCICDWIELRQSVGDFKDIPAEDIKELRYKGPVEIRKGLKDIAEVYATLSRL